MSETVRDVCDEMRDDDGGCYFPFTDDEVVRTPKIAHLLNVMADHILAAYEHEMAAKDEMNRIKVQSAQARFDDELAAKDAEITRLRTAFRTRRFRSSNRDFVRKVFARKNVDSLKIPALRSSRFTHAENARHP